MIIVLQIVQVFTQVLIFAIIIRSLISWFPIDRDGPVVRALDAVVDPIMVPLRRVIPPLGMIDLTPMAAILLLLFIQSVLASAV